MFTWQRDLWFPNIRGRASRNISCFRVHLSILFLPHQFNSILQPDSGCPGVSYTTALVFVESIVVAGLPILPISISPLSSHVHWHYLLPRIYSMQYVLLTKHLIAWVMDYNTRSISSYMVVTSCDLKIFLHRHASVQLKFHLERTFVGWNYVIQRMPYVWLLGP
jgi:hypothetical protein